MVAGIAAISVLVGYWVWHQDQATAAVQRTLPDVFVRWRCPEGHVFEDRGSYEPRPCPTCRQPARIRITYRCPKDGVFDALVMYDGATRKLSAVQFEAGPWVPITTVVPCPQCGGELRTKQRSPFERSDPGDRARPVAPGSP